jgi:hypothetical protein
MQSRRPSFDHLVGKGKELRRNFEPERVRGLEVDDEFKLGGRLRRKLARVGALEDAIDIRSLAPEDVRRFRPV